MPQTVRASARSQARLVQPPGAGWRGLSIAITSGWAARAHATMSPTRWRERIATTAESVTSAASNPLRAAPTSTPSHGPVTAGTRRPPPPLLRARARSQHRGRQRPVVLRPRRAVAERLQADVVGARVAVGAHRDGDRLGPTVGDHHVDQAVAAPARDVLVGEAEPLQVAAVVAERQIGLGVRAGVPA